MIANKRPTLIAAMVLTPLLLGWGGVQLGGGVPAAGGFTGGVVWVDSAAADNIAADYTLDAGSIVFDTDHYQTNTGSTSILRRDGDAHLSVNQWGVLQMNDFPMGTTNNHEGFMFRDGATEKDHYTVVLKNDGVLLWGRTPAGTISYNNIQSSGDLGSPADTNYFYACVEGTGTSTIVKGWLAASDPGDCSDTCTNNCGWGAPSTGVYTNDPGAEAVDTGLVSGNVASDFGNPGRPGWSDVTLGDCD